MTGLPLGPLAQLAPRVSTLLAQRGVQAMVAGLVAGAVSGSAMMATGLVRFGEAPAPTAASVALMACPGSGPVLAEVPTGQSLLVTARSADGSWLQVYLGEPGVDRAWAPAGVLRLASSADGLPVDQCAAPASPTPFPTATITAVVTPTPSAEPTATPTGEPTASPTATPSATPKQTTKPDTTPPSAPELSGSTFGPTQINLSWTASTDNVGVVRYRVYRGGSQIAQVTTRSYSDTGLAPSTAYSYTVRAVDAAGNVSVPSNKITLTTPSGATPAPTPSPDTTAPNMSNLTATGPDCFGVIQIDTGTSATISVTASDAGGVAGVILYYTPSGGLTYQYGMFFNTTTGKWQGTITGQSGWNEGQVTYYVRGYDTNNNYSSPTYPASQYNVWYSHSCVG
ncbi:MAG TPA: hypothetical protein VGA36_05650 [Nitriliruptorales bacterium]